MAGQRVKRHTCVFGLGWGDEGKGKIVDLLCPDFDIVVRYNGGANAGHTVQIGDEKFAMHLLPSGVLHPGTIGVIGPGVVVDPVTLLQEVDQLQARGIGVLDRLRISERAHLVLAYHKIEDQLSERTAADTTKIGTTARGIGPCYADKARRSWAIRFADLLHDNHLDDRVRQIVVAKKATFHALYHDDGGLDAEAVIADLDTARSRLAPLLCESGGFLRDAMAEGKTVLFEGANGMLLDIDHGTYPFVTSSSTGPHGIAAGAGVPLSRVERLLGVIKAYATRVGSGPFVSELDDEVGDRIRRQGNEYGTTTGRPRRCGWFDAVATRYTTELAGCSELALMHLDTLSGFDEVGICTEYRGDGQSLTPAADFRRLEKSEPVFEMLPGWKEDIRGVRSFDGLPRAAMAYVERMEHHVGARVSIISVGPERTQTLIRNG